MKEAGNSLYLGGENTEAAAKYTEGLNVCPLCFTEDRAILYANRAAVHIKTVELNVSLPFNPTSERLKGNRS